MMRTLVAQWGIEAEDAHERAQLHWAALRGHVLSALMVLQADMKAKDVCGWRPLHDAAFNGHVEAVRLWWSWRRTSRQWMLWHEGAALGDSPGAL
jgi:ankyrin repeat protein